MSSRTKSTKIARPAARKSSGRNKPAKSGSRPSRKEPETGAVEKTVQAVEPQNPRRRVVELPKVPGELPTPTATFYF